MAVSQLLQFAGRVDKLCISDISKIKEIT